MKNSPLLTVLAFSGGKQSSALLWMIILGYIKIPDNFVVLFANPGMENSSTYEYVDMMFEKAGAVGIDCRKVVGPNLYKDIINLKSTSKTRFDTPKYFVKKEDGKLATLKQGCTQVYKIQPMDREIRRVLLDKFNISINKKRLGNNVVEKWIGFTLSEVSRVKPSPRRYWYFRYPLIDMKMTNEDVIKFYLKNSLPIPSRSVCNGCFANGLNYLRDMFHTRPDDWQQAVNIDNEIRDWSQIGVKNPVYVSNTLIPLQELAKADFDVSKLKENLEEDYSCDSGYCFI